MSVTLLEVLCLNALMAYSAYMVLSGGTFDLGFIAYMGLGVYAGALLYREFQLGMVIALVVGLALAVLVASLMGRVLAHLKGIYLAIATTSLVAVTNVILTNWRSFTGGATGVHGIPLRSGILLLSVSVLLVVGLAIRMDVSAYGRSVRMARLDPMLAETLGVKIPRIRLGLVVLSAVIAASAGVLRVYYYGFAVPDDVGFGILVEVLAMALLGGVVHWSGPLIGASIFTLLPEFLRPIGDWREISTGLILLLVIVLLPEGIAGGVARWVRHWRAGRSAAASDPSSRPHGRLLGTTDGVRTGGGVPPNGTSPTPGPGTSEKR